MSFSDAAQLSVHKTLGKVKHILHHSISFKSCAIGPFENIRHSFLSLWNIVGPQSGSASAQKLRFNRLIPLRYAHQLLTVATHQEVCTTNCYHHLLQNFRFTGPKGWPCGLNFTWHSDCQAASWGMGATCTSDRDGGLQRGRVVQGMVGET